jgi:nicotinamidase-related amidase
VSGTDDASRSGAHDLHGNAPDQCQTALLLVDVINDFEFEGGDALLENATRVAPEIGALTRVARSARVPVIYANDNRGKWRSDFRAVLSHCLNEDCKGRALAEQLLPGEEDYIVLKTKHSAFFGTSLDLLLTHLGTRKLVLCGFATDQCVLFTALDAYLRDYSVAVPRDCTAAQRTEDAELTLRLIERSASADIRAWQCIELPGRVA